MIINAEIYTMDESGKVIKNGYIKDVDGKITEIGEMCELDDCPLDAFDAKGARVYPGMVDAHTHLGLFEEGIAFEGDDGNEDTDPVTPHMRAIDGSNPMDGYFRQALEAGITTVLISPGSTNPIAGEIAAVKTYGKRIDKMILKAPAAIKMSLGENPKSTYNDKDQSPVTRMAVAALIRETLARAKKYADEKDAADNDSSLDPPEYDMKYESLYPVMRRKIPVHFHAHRADDIFTALRISSEFNIKCVIVHGTEGHLIAGDLAEDGIGVLSGPFMTDRSKPELKNMTAASPGLLSSAGIKTAIITDHPETPINYLSLCAAVAVREGMEKNMAIRAVTVVPAEICGIADKVGSLEIGKDADYYIIDGDPLDIMNKPSAVFINGRKVI